MKGKEIQIQPPEKLIEMVRFIATMKDNLSSGDRRALDIGAVHCNVSHTPSGQLQFSAGGRFITKLKFTVEDDSSISLKTYKPGAWESSVEEVYNGYWNHWRDITPSEKLIIKRENEKHKDRLEQISQHEKQAQKEPQNPLPHSNISRLYEQDGRFKDMENATKKSLELTKAKFIDDEGAGWSDYKRLGMIYVAALSYLFRGHGTPISGYVPVNITPESLGYTSEELIQLAKDNLEKALRLAKFAGLDEEALDNSYIKMIKRALKAVEQRSNDSFEKYEEYLVEGDE